MRRNKIICTIGPKSASAEVLKKYADAGMSVARLNGSHNTLEWHKEIISLIQETVSHIPILIDIPGKKIRTMHLDHEPSFAVGDKVTLTTTTSYRGSEKVTIGHSTLHQFLKKDDRIFADDGQLAFVVESLEENDIICRSLVAGTLKSRKGINVPGVDLGAELVTEMDYKMLKFACENNVDFVGISFVESKLHIESIRNILISYSSKQTHPKIVAKVENLKGMENLEEILQAADVIMIDRGDLAVETDLAHVVLYQKMIIERARKYGVPVIVATEMLHTMVNQSCPTKAEVADITNAILDKASAIMLSGETAVGDFGLEAIQLMKRLTDVVPAFETSQQTQLACEGGEKYYHHIISGAKALCDTLPITKIVTITKTGFASRMMSSMQPKQEILCVTNDIHTAKAANLLYGTRGIYLDLSFARDSTAHIEKSLKLLIDHKHVAPEDFILLLFVSYPKQGNLTNSIQLHYVRDLITALENI